MSATRHAACVTVFLAFAMLTMTACAPINDTADDTAGDAPEAPPMSSPLPPERAPQPAPGMDDKCDAKAAQAYVGQTASADVAAQAKTAAGANSVRTLKPGQMVTMEFRAGRLNLDVDANNVITSARCG